MRELGLGLRKPLVREHSEEESTQLLLQQRKQTSKITFLAQSNSNIVQFYPGRDKLIKCSLSTPFPINTPLTKGIKDITFQWDESPENFAHKESPLLKNKESTRLKNEGKRNLCEVIFDSKLRPGKKINLFSNFFFCYFSVRSGYNTYVPKCEFHQNNLENQKILKIHIDLQTVK